MSSGEFVSNCTADSLAQAAQLLKDGGLVALPTETVYGLGADATNADAVARIYKVKGRPADHPLIVHIHSMHSLGDWADEIPSYAISLARDFWPGPMTLVLKRSILAEDFVTGGQPTVGLRVPDHVVALALLSAFEKIGGKAIAAPSANRFGHVSPTTAQAVQEELGEFLEDRDQILDGGPSTVGVESTIIDCTSDAPRILRPGAITIEMVEESTGLKVSTSKTDIRVSGSLENHYAPQASVFLNRAPLSGEGFIALADVQTPENVTRLASPKNVEEFARVMYSALREADVHQLKSVVVAEPAGDGLALAIRDRLMRASKGR
ncbi:MAG: threonylcarbamoyl-AMP synthase [Candidatus Planktophila sp.]|nr:threonylcarbamoyl-AMP synthase [Candidatus Planktophila sp.]